MGLTLRKPTDLVKVSRETVTLAGRLVLTWSIGQMEGRKVGGMVGSGRMGGEDRRGSTMVYAWEGSLWAKLVRRRGAGCGRRGGMGAVRGWIREQDGEGRGVDVDRRRVGVGRGTMEQEEE